MNGRALFVIFYPVFGGPHNEVLRLYGELRLRGWDLTAVIPDEPGTAELRLAEGEVPTVRLPLHRLRATVDPRPHVALASGLRREVSGLRQVIRNVSADVVVTSGLTNPHAALAARRESVPLVWQIPDTRVPPCARPALLAMVSRWSSAVMFTGDGVRQAHRLTDQSIARVVYFPPVDTERFKPTPEGGLGTRFEMGIPSNAPVVGMVGNLNPQKGVEYFIRAAGAIYQAVPKTWFLIVGASYDTHRGYEARLRSEINASGVPAERFVFAGGRRDPERWYPAMDVMVLASVPNSEGTPTTVEEAMACGVPVIAADVGAVREVIADGATGYVVPPRDPSAIADTVVKVLTDSELGRSMGERGRAEAERRFDVKVVADAYVEAFEEAIRHAERARVSAPPWSTRCRRGGWGSAG